MHRLFSLARSPLRRLATFFDFTITPVVCFLLLYVQNIHRIFAYMKERILHTAVKKINGLYGFQCQVLGYNFLERQSIDAQFLFQKDGYQQEYGAIVKSKVVPAQIPNLKEQIEGLAHCFLIAEYITPQAKEILRNEHIPYLDTAGNVYLNDKRIYIFIENNKTNRSKLPTSNGAFKKAGLKVVYQFLVHPEYLNMPYRFIAEHASVTIDTVRRVFQGLLQDKYIIRANKKEYQFVDRAKLFQEWVTAFNINLRPKLKQNRCKWLNKNQTWQNTKLPKQSFWGGAVAAGKLNNYLIADKAIVYTQQPFGEVMKKLKIIPDPNGTITLMEQFWKEEEDKKIPHPMLIYADLINDASPRYIEAANKIYKEHVEDKL